jgi:torulene dioxygenase
MKPWDPNEKTLFHVIDRSARKLVATYTSVAFFCFHTLNAWDEEDDIVLDLVQYKDISIIEKLSMETLMGAKENSVLDCARIHRYRLAKISQQNESIDMANLPEAELVFNVPEELNSELSSIDFSRYHLKKHRYAYGTK